MDTCSSRQLPLRDTYIPCSEPINPYHGNYVSVNLSKPWILNLPVQADNLWDTQEHYWYVHSLLTNNSSFTSVPQWSDICRNFIMPTYCVRTWGNGSYWWNPNHYYDFSTRQLTPLSRSAKYPEAQIGDQMFLRATLLSLPSFYYTDNGGNILLQYSEYPYDGGNMYGDFYNNGEREYTIPSYGTDTPIPHEYKTVNNIMNSNLYTPFAQGMGRIGGFNLTLFVVEARVNTQTTPSLCVPASAFMTVSFKPLVPYSDLSGCWLRPPTNYSSYTNKEDWDGTYLPETSAGANPNNPATWAESGVVESVLPTIEANFPSSQKCFHVVLPVQLYTAIPCSSAYPFTFSLGDFQNGSVVGPLSYITQIGLNMVTVAVKLRGVFLDIEGEPCTAGQAESIQFEVVDPEEVVSLSHTYQNTMGVLNRPIMCTETGSLPILKSNVTLPVTTSLLFAPKCGPGMWTNLPEAQPLAGYNWGA